MIQIIQITLIKTSILSIGNSFLTLLLLQNVLTKRLNDKQVSIISFKQFET